MRAYDQIEDRGPGRERDEKVIDRGQREVLRGQVEPPQFRGDDGRNGYRPDSGQRQHVDVDVGRLAPGRRAPSGASSARKSVSSAKAGQKSALSTEPKIRSVAESALRPPKEEKRRIGSREWTIAHG